MSQDQLPRGRFMSSAELRVNILQATGIIPVKYLMSILSCIMMDNPLCIPYIIPLATPIIESYSLGFFIN